MAERIKAGRLAISILPIGNGADDLCAGLFGTLDDRVNIIHEQTDDDACGLCRFRAQLI